MPVEPSIPGYRACNSCKKQFLSRDKDRIRRCDACHKKEESYSPRVARIVDVYGAIRQQTGDR